MADLFLPVSVGALGLVLAAYTWDLKQKLNIPVEMAAQDSDVKQPFLGAMGHFRQWSGVDTRGRFRSVQETTDALGADIFLVDYGNGCLVTQYHDPRILL